MGTWNQTKKTVHGLTTSSWKGQIGILWLIHEDRQALNGHMITHSGASFPIAVDIALFQMSIGVGKPELDLADESIVTSKPEDEV